MMRGVVKVTKPPSSRPLSSKSPVTVTFFFGTSGGGSVTTDDGGVIDVGVIVFMFW